MIRNYNLCGRRFPLQLGVALVPFAFEIYMFAILFVVLIVKVSPIFGY